MIHSYDTDEDEEDAEEKKRTALLQKKQNVEETHALASAAVDVWRSLLQA